MKRILWLLLVACLASPALAEPITRVHYHAWDAGVDVDLVKRTLVRSETRYEYPSEVSGTPSGSTGVTHPALTITPEQVAGLRAFVRECGFMDLKAAYGAPEDQRFYPYEITVYLEGGKTKSVLYRSNPSYEEAPEAFRKLRDYLDGMTGTSSGS